MTVALVTTAKSSMNAERRSPKYGDLTAATFKVLRIALTTKACRASPSMSSAIIKVGLLDSAIFSSSGRKSGSEEIRSEEHTSELQSRFDLVCRLLLDK